ncbi:MAG: hypothetical protein FJ109_06190 [Deltaproteobacteria bacterium]|nr:hypothetical protein [Deltaproteobacteria bacterium]
MELDMRFSDSSLAAWPMALVLAVAPAVCGCSFNVIMPPVSQDDSSVPEEEVSPIDLAAPDTGEDLTPEVVGPGCKVDADCETDVPVGAGPQCTLWGCDPQSQQCDWVAVKDGTACKGDDACVQSWKCMGGACKKHSSIDCDDKNPCTTDFCDSAKGCQHAAADGVGCNDGKQCTTGDVWGVCKGQEYCPTVALCEVGQCNDEGFCEYFATPGRPGCGDCSPWGVPGPEGAMLQCCQESGQVLVPRMFCEEDFPFVCGGTSQAECEELCAPFCQTNQQVCIPCGNGTCDEFENACKNASRTAGRGRQAASMISSVVPGGVAWAGSASRARSVRRRRSATTARTTTATRWSTSPTVCLKRRASRRRVTSRPALRIWSRSTPRPSPVPRLRSRGPRQWRPRSRRLAKGLAVRSRR